MPPFRYRWRRNYWKRKPRRRRFRRRNFTTYFRRRLYGRRRTVRRKKNRKYRKKKLKKIIITQWQPDKIRKCRIEGIFPLFHAAPGRKSNNFELYKESKTAPAKPGGGGWSIFQISLDELYKRHERLENWWTHSNKGLNLVRYLGLRAKFYRQPTTDYVVNYQISYPFEVGKYNYMSTQPQRMLMYHKKIVVPSFATSPLLRKTYIYKKIKPPKEFLNKWFFQKELSRFGLVMLTTCACSLTNFFIAPQAENNTVHLWSLNTKIFKHKDFKQQNHASFGYYPGPSYYLYGEKNGGTGDKPNRENLIYLGNSNTFQDGDPIGQNEWGGPVGTQYPYEKWGNPFYDNFIDKTQTVWVSQQQPSEILKKTNNPVQNVTRMTNDILTLCSYNPLADKGYGNEAYWVKLYYLENGWETPATFDLKYEGFPLWVMLWGLEDYTIKSKKLQHLETDYALVVKSSYITPELPYYVFLSDSFHDGQGPYHTEKEYTSDFYYKNWYPCWQYQKEAIENLLMSGPATNKETHQIQAHMYYDFSFKWGGSPAYIEGVTDPVQQPDYPLPNNEQEGYEIENPENDPTKELYSFDIRRDFITKAAAERLKQDSQTEISLFTDGVPTTRKLPIQSCQKTIQKKKKKTQKTKKETLQLKLQLLRDHRQQLRHRYHNLTKLLLNSKSHTVESE